MFLADRAVVNKPPHFILTEERIRWIKYLEIEKR